ncbi:hypothetical protein AQUCO_01300587v1 [Aquilegia coerulea]|uniref:F-box domain-containing protein n=1 Tax=Aquilegia coerulea TaxID=218851 RepID=A0A2G5E2G2_AQUCA|nr:hypothetical protein AQUCO_01300587v1 [Aquilegia coerulea]
MRIMFKQEEEEKQGQEESELMPNLPNDIMFNILLKLPIKTLKKFRQVNKSWYKTIKQPDFIKAHYAKVIQNNSDYDDVFEIDSCCYIDDESLGSFETPIPTFFTSKHYIPVARKWMRKNNEEEEASELLSNLPNEIAFDILLRLPIKTLSACRWVNKTWYKTIKQSDFIKAHHAKVIQNNPGCLIGVRDIWYFIDHESMGSSQTSTNSLPLITLKEQPLQDTENSFRFFSCNGLVLVCSGERPYSINNPITGEQVLVPQSINYERSVEAQGTSRLTSLLHDQCIGFGFDSVSEVFKLLRIYRDPGKAYMEVLNCGTGTCQWRVIDNDPYSLKLIND